MTSYAEMARERRKARPLFLELRALDLELHIKEDPADLTGYRLAITGLRSLSPAHAARIRRRVEASKLGLLIVEDWTNFDPLGLMQQLGLLPEQQ